VIATLTTLPTIMGISPARWLRRHTDRFCALQRCACVALLFTAAGCTRLGAQVVTPAERDLGFGRTNTVEIHADLGRVAVSHQPMDILLVFDRTQSMASTIGEAQTNADEIVRGVRAMYPNSMFAVAGLADHFGGEEPWLLLSDFTQETGKIRAALGAITLADGFDFPESYSRALSESRFVSWRPGAQRYLVLFGDAPAHDPDFYGKDFGIDPGRDGIPGTRDDLRLKSVIADLATDGIVILAIYDDTFQKPMKAEARQGFDYMARQTGGVSLPISSATEVVDIVQQSLRRVLQPAPSLAAPAEFADWIRGEAFRRDADSVNTFSTPVGVVVPDGAKSGIYRLPVAVIRHHSAGVDTLGVTSIIVRVGLLNYPWRLPLLILFFLSLLGTLIRHARRASREFLLYERTTPFLRLLRQIAVAGLVATGGLLIWKYAPGTLQTEVGMSSAAEP